MVVRSILTRLAKKAPVPVFLISGIGGDEIADGLRLDERLQVMDSPRPAMVLMIVGRLTGGLNGAVLQVHDQMAEPRAVVRWSPSEFDASAAIFPHLLVMDAVPAEAADSLAAAAVEARDDLLAGRLPSSHPLLPDIDPNPWRGVGPWGQGGTGMTGGVPYGRPLPERAKDRDGLQLDQLLVRLGPFMPALPEGLVLEVRLQGDVIQDVVVGENPFAEEAGSASRQEAFSPLTGPAELAPFLAALRVPVAIAELERARARHHLRWLGHTLRMHGLTGLCRRVLALSARVYPGGAGLRSALATAEVAELRRWLERNFTLAWVTRGIGRLSADQLAALDGGPVARAGGVERDERLADPAYLALGFEPVTRTRGDALARWRLRLQEAERSLRLAEIAGDTMTTVTGAVEGPTGPLGRGLAPSSRLLPLLPDLLGGLEWGDAVVTLLSLDLDLREAALTPPGSGTVPAWAW
ncbi:MAG: NADH-quinone oxidoreductase subunit D-related protein [Thermoleophilia bacterium]